MTTFRSSLLLILVATMLLVSCGKQERTVDEEVAEMRAQWDREDPPVFATPTSEGEAYNVPSDPNATYRLLRWKRLKNETVEAVTRRDGASGTSFTRMLVDCGIPRYKVVGEGDTQDDALRSLSYESAWADLVSGSIKDVTVSLVCRKLVK